MLDIQLGRRNLSPIQRIAVAEKYRPIYEKQAKENLVNAGRMFGIGKERDEKPSQNSSKAIDKIDVRAKLAKTAGVSTDTYSKEKKILESDNEELKERVLLGETSISAGYYIKNVKFWRSVMTSKIKYINFLDKIYRVSHISFFTMKLVAEETTLTAATVPEDEVFDVMDYPGLKVTLIGLDGQSEEIDLKELSRRVG